jgi:hypothetical protein
MPQRCQKNTSRRILREPFHVAAALPAPQGSHLLAATDRGLYLWAEGREAWRPFNPGAATRPVVAVVPSPDFRCDRSVYSLELGGTLWQLHLPMKA